MCGVSSLASQIWVDLTQILSSLQRPFFYSPASSLSQGFYCCDKTVTIRNWKRKVYFVLQFEVHHPGSRAGTDAEPRRTATYWLVAYDLVCLYLYTIPEP